MSFGEVIRKTRRQKNLTLRELEFLSGVSYSQISKIERLENLPSRETILKLSNALELDIDFSEIATHANISEDFKDLTRFQVLVRDNFTCQLCGNKAPDVKLVVSQVNPDENNEVQNYKNLLTLCSQCNNGRLKLIEQEGINKDILYNGYLKNDN